MKPDVAHDWRARPEKQKNDGKTSLFSPTKTAIHFDQQCPQYYDDDQQASTRRDCSRCWSRTSHSTGYGWISSSDHCLLHPSDRRRQGTTNIMMSFCIPFLLGKSFFFDSSSGIKRKYSLYLLDLQLDGRTLRDWKMPHSFGFDLQDSQ